MMTPRALVLPLLALSVPALLTAAKMEGDTNAGKPVSFYHEVRPILQANCHGCHQPAKAKGDYIMTDFAKLVAGGETAAAIIAHKPTDSYILDLVRPVDGEVEMPPKGDPLSAEDIAIMERWIAEGARDDTPANAVERYGPENPPLYVKPPVITSIDHSPDGKWIAVTGFHEILIHKADGSGLAGRLIGLSERIESVKFSPDGKKLAATGGLPGRMGELQVWDMETKELDLSLPVGFDTIYGASWSPDGKLIAFGMPDNTVRAVKASNGEQIMFMGGHNDWVLDTVFSQKGDHVISVSRDMSTKLTEVASERFIDNITSITPKALKGGISALEMHPEQDHILVGGSDGVPQIYRIKRETVRKIGDNANLIRKYPEMEGRIWAVSFSPDGKRFVAGSSLDGRGMVNFYNSEYDATITPELKKAMETARRAADSPQQKLIDEFQTRGVKQLGSINLDTSIYALSWSPDGKSVVATGDDGILRFIDPNSAKITKEVVPVELTAPAALAENVEAPTPKPDRDEFSEKLPKGRSVTALEVNPKNVQIDGPVRYQQVLVTAKLNTGETADVTRMVSWDMDKPLVEITNRGMIRPAQDGKGQLTVTLGEHTATLPVHVANQNATLYPDWIQDVNPAISRMGCNMGTCHGAKDGREGFKLSLRGYDPLYDLRAFTDDIKSRRVNYASPDDSLMLLKGTTGVPHEGGQVMQQHSPYYRIVREWIANGAELDLSSPKVKSIELHPKNPVIQNIGGRQQFRVVATFVDGKKRDVTAEAFVESGNSEVLKHDDYGLTTTLRRGEAPILARYEGAYAATTLTVMGDREGFEWVDPPGWNRIDELVAEKWDRMKIQPSGLSTDEEFLRRVYLDLTGLPPAAEEVRKFLADKTPQRKKRDAVIDHLIGSPEFVEHWTNKWSDLLQVNSKFLGAEGTKIFREWIHTHIAENTPYDKFVYDILTASGSNKENPAASYYKILREPDMLVENTTHLFLATRFNCNKCHDHPFERWTQDQYYETAAWFAQVDLKRDTKNAPKQNIGGTAVEDAKPLFELVEDATEGEMKHSRTGVEQPPAFPYPAETAPVSFKAPENPNRREEMATWMVAPDNQFFAMSYANRIWGYLLGTGVIEPLDDIRAGNPPSNPELLSFLTDQFIQNGFDQRQLMEMICKSRTYQLSIETNQWNEDDDRNFSHAKARRLPAEVLFDAVYTVTGATSNIPGAEPGTRAQELVDAQLDLKSGFLANLGRPARESSCECERSNDMQMSAVMAFLSGPTIADAVGDPDNALTEMAKRITDDRKLVEEIYMRVLNRAPRDGEIEAAIASFSEIENDHDKLVALLAKAEAEWVPERSQLEVDRLKAIQKANADIAAYEPEYLKKKREAEAAQKQRIADAEKALNETKASLPAAVTEWEKTLTVQDMWTTWKPLIPTSVTLSDKSEAEILPDGSVRAKSLNLRKLDFLVSGITRESGITGIMIEAIPDETFPGFGAGLNPNGNLVVTEVQSRWNTKADPKTQKPISFSNAAADHNQGGFDVKNVINGKLDRNDKGWALAGSNHQAPHQAMLQLKEPMAGDPEGATLTVGVLSRYSNGDYPIGRFRIWTTTSSTPLQIGLPHDVATAVAVAPKSRSDAQKAVVLDWVTQNHETYLKQTFAIAKEKRPLPADTKMVALKATLTTAEIAVVDDPRVVQLRQDVSYSIEQAANRRLTAAQDLTWALINNPAFLFNR